MEKEQPRKAVYTPLETHQRLKLAAVKAHKPMCEYLADLLDKEEQNEHQ